MADDRQKRKAYAKGEARGVATQKMVTFKLDLKLAAWLDSKPNKGRYLNNLIERDIKTAIASGEHHEELQE